MTKQSPPDDLSIDILSRVAQRVREARKALKMPRRVLSDISGVSPRYLAQLEAGSGNISIVLLQRVAAALAIPLEALLSDLPPPEDGAQRIARLYQNAPREVQKEVAQLLEQDKKSGHRAGRICLVGLRGAGKSTLGKLVAGALGLPFVELNAEIEAQTGMPLPEILALYGHEGYRRLEAEAVDRTLMEHDRVVLAVAGGIVAQEKTYAGVLSRFHTIWLRATPGEHMERVRAQGDLRPMAGNPAAMSQLRFLLETRTPMYERAEAQLDTSNKSVKQSQNDLLGIIAGQGFLDG